MPVEYQTVVVGAAYLTQHLLERLGVGAAIDQELKYQPDIAATYGQLAQAVILNRMTLSSTAAVSVGGMGSGAWHRPADADPGRMAG